MNILDNIAIKYGTDKSSEFHNIKPGGLYIVEDVCTSYWEEFGGGLLKNVTTMEYFKKLTDDINFRGLPYYINNQVVRREDVLIPYSEKIQPDCITNIESINFLNGIIILTKANVTR